jgi:(p)ppGpp synthase/HD superfamily hydrolase
MAKDIVKLAEKCCVYFHDMQKRKGGNQEPYSVHPFAVRDILVRYGYDDDETQALALLHDTVEDTELGKFKQEIEKRFGTVVYEGVYVLSKNTTGKNAGKLSCLFDSLGVKMVGADGFLTPQAYKLRLLFNRDSVKRVKIADMIHNTEDLSDLSKGGIEKKIVDAEIFYIPLGKIVAPIMVCELATNISNYMHSDHYKRTFS